MKAILSSPVPLFTIMLVCLIIGADVSQCYSPALRCVIQVALRGVRAPSPPPHCPHSLLHPHRLLLPPNHPPLPPLLKTKITVAISFCFIYATQTWSLKICDHVWINRNSKAQRNASYYTKCTLILVISVYCGV